MKTNLHTLFSTPLYIEPAFGISCIPVLYDVLKNSKTSTSEASADSEKPNISVHKLSASGDKGSTSEKSVVVFSLNQPIVKYSNYSWLGTQSIIRILNSYKQDESVLGVVLKVDSGGGQAYGTPILYDYIKEFTQSKPLIVYTDGFLCSAAYYLAAPATKIIANKRAEAIGSIGAYATIIDFNGIWEHFGAKVHTMYADESTEKNHEYREVLKGNYEPYIKNELNPLVTQFREDMRSARPQIKEGAFHGKTFAGDEAVVMGLADELGTLETAIQSVINLSSNNSNSNTMSKERLKIQAVLNLESPLAANENGSYLNDEQLDTIETALADKDTTISSLTTELEAARNNTELSEKLTTTESSLSDAETAVDGMLTASGLPVEGSLTEKLSALNTKVAEMAKQPGATTTIPVVTTERKGTFAIDASAEHNQIANQITKKS